MSSNESIVTESASSAAVASDKLLEHYRSMVKQALSEQEWLHPRQRQVAERLASLKLPNNRQESWRYTPLTPLLSQTFNLAQLEADLLTPEDVAQWRLTEADSPRAVFLNGFFMPELSHLPDNCGVEISSLRSGLCQGDSDVFERMSALGSWQHFFSALNTAMASEGALIRVLKDAVLAQPIEVMHVTYSFESQFLTQPRLLVLVEDGAEATLVEQHFALSDTTCLNNHVTEIFLGEGAKLTHPRLQNESLRARHLASINICQRSDSVYRSTSLAFGGLLSRTEWQLEFAEYDAHCELNGFYLAGQDQTHDMQLNVIHAVPSCSSEELFKGMLYANGRAIFDGNIVVRPDAQKTDAKLSNANLLLSTDAETYTKPRLEIYADDVKCSHGTTVGQLDPEALFYLRARGIPKQDAMLMVASGFAGEVIDSCGWEPLQKRATDLLNTRLATVAVS